MNVPVLCSSTTADGIYAQSMMWPTSMVNSIRIGDNVLSLDKKRIGRIISIAHGMGLVLGAKAAEDAPILYITLG